MNNGVNDQTKQSVLHLHRQLTNKYESMCSLSRIHVLKNGRKQTENEFSKALWCFLLPFLQAAL